jgi:DNA invertase Pin-like site-specific DNA recombinase
MQWIIYYRKSTDRDDKQANSLEHQLNNCHRTAKNRWINIVEEISECRSAKEEFSRPWFNRLIDVCKRKRIDYIVIDEPKRLSRNNIDTSRIIDLLDKKKIIWILWTSREYQADNSRDKFLLQLDLSLSKMDNEDRSKDVKDKMNSCTEKTGRFLGKAPFWYTNVTIKKWHKEIHVDRLQAKIVKDIFSLRADGIAFSKIGHMIWKKHGECIGITLFPSSLQRLVNNRFYYGVFSWAWKDIIGSHTTLITKECFDKANSIWKWTHERKITKLKLNSKTKLSYYLKWFAKDISGKRLCAYIQKWHIYYINQSKSDEKVNINQKLIFDKFWSYLKIFDEKINKFQPFDKSIVETLIHQRVSLISSELWILKQKINTLKSQQEKLLDMKIDGLIENEAFLRKNNKIEADIFNFKKQKVKLSANDYKQKTWLVIELSQGLYKALTWSSKFSHPS